MTIAITCYEQFSIHYVTRQAEPQKCSLNGTQKGANSYQYSWFIQEIKLQILIVFYFTLKHSYKCIESPHLLLFWHPGVCFFSLFFLFSEKTMYSFGTNLLVFAFHYIEWQCSRHNAFVTLCSSAKHTRLLDKATTIFTLSAKSIIALNNTTDIMKAGQNACSSFFGCSIDRLSFPQLLFLLFILLFIQWERKLSR